MTIKINFKKQISVKEAQTLAKTAKKSGIKIKLPCDGKGKCGKCKVKITGKNIPEATKNEEKLLKKKDIDEGIRLACETVIDKDCDIEIL